MAWFMGIDIGSMYTKGVLTNGDDIAAAAVSLSGNNYRRTAEKIRKELLQQARVPGHARTMTVATGSGAANARFADETVSDLVCTARGVHRVFPQARTVIEVAGQATKVMRIDGQGRVTNFAVSEKCAAGSGRFVEVIANVLRIDLADFGPLSLLSQSPVAFSTGCAVFGESEAVTRVAQGASKEDIAAGVNRALADKVASMVKKVRLEEPCAICGGGALNVGLIRMAEQRLGIRLLVPPQPQIVAALGAAITAGRLGSGA